VFRKIRLAVHKILHWEYWPFQVVYIPVYFLWLYYAVKAKSLFFFNAANPSITNGGFMMESKKEIYDLIPTQFYPKTELIKEGTAASAVQKVAIDAGIKYPFIAKPDIGLRGSGVKKIENSTDLETYASKANFDYVIQNLIPYTNEVGIFYVRYPNQKAGKITGIVSKEFLIVEGDGVLTVEQLVRLNPRFEMQLPSLQREYGSMLNTVLAQGQKLNLVPYGNHARGAKFIDGSHWITPKLEAMMNTICLQIDGFYFGRLDIMYDSFTDLEQGKNFAIVELNGAGSEPTHIYDPKHSLFFAWKELMRHITYMYEISVINHKNGVAYLQHNDGVREYKLHIQQSNKITNF
jgi:hypothetical protein